MHALWIWGIDFPLSPAGLTTPSPAGVAAVEAGVALFRALVAWLGAATDPALFGAVHDEGHRARWRAMREAHAAYLASREPKGAAPTPPETTNRAPGSTSGPTTPP